MSALQRHLVRRGVRAFTLVELLVAMLAGMVVAVGAFAFAKNSTRSFQSEARLGNATSSATMGFRRLVGDLRRASFLSSPNIQREYRVGNTVCLSPSGMVPQGIQTLAGVYIEHWGYVPQTALRPEFVQAQTLNDATMTANAAAGTAITPLMPDRITIAGSFDSTEQFFIRSVTNVNGTLQVAIQSASGASTRLLRGLATNTAALNDVFKPNRIGRIVDKRGFQHFGVISGATIVNDPTFGMPQIVITLAANPPQYIQSQLLVGGVAKATCDGMDPQGSGMLFNVVNKIRYEVRTADNIPDLAALYGNPLGNANTNPNAPTIAAPAEDATRAELIRTELDYNDVPIPGTDELVAEYAVDLKFGISVDTAGAPGANNPAPQVNTFDVGNPFVYQWAGSVLAATNQPGPERIKSVRVRFATRSREADRASNIAAPVTGWPLTGAGLAGGIFRYQVGTTPTTDRWARVRTLQAEVSLLNQAGVFY